MGGDQVGICLLFDWLDWMNQAGICLLFDWLDGVIKQVFVYFFLLFSLY